MRAGNRSPPTKRIRCGAGPRYAICGSRTHRSRQAWRGCRQARLGFAACMKVRVRFFSSSRHSLRGKRSTREHLPRPPCSLSASMLRASPALDRPEADEGLSKRTYGIASGHVLLIGDGDVLHVCEGLADGLRIRRYEGGTVAIVCGTAGMRQCATWQGIEHYRRIRLWPDGDKGGREAAQLAGQALANREITVSIMRLPNGVDPAEAPLKRRSASQNTASRPKHQEQHTSSVDVTGDVDRDNDVAIAAAFTDLTAQYTKRTVL